MSQRASGHLDMLDHLITATLELREADPKASYFIAKELAIISLNMLWYPDKVEDEVARLRSLANHLLITFNKNKQATTLASNMNTTAFLLSTSFK